MLNDISPTNRWYVLILSTFTLIFSTAMPLMSMPVLFTEISEELGLNLVQIGTVWGLWSFAAVIMVFIAGMFVDRFGIKRVLIMVSILAGILGASRGLAIDFWSLALSVLSFGLVAPIVPVVVHRGAAIWFSKRQLGLTNGLIVTSA